MHMVQFRVFKALVVIFVKVKDVFRLCFAELLKILDQFYYKMSLSTLGAASNGKKERPDNFNHDQEKMSVSMFFYAFFRFPRRGGAGEVLTIIAWICLWMALLSSAHLEIKQSEQFN